MLGMMIRIRTCEDRLAELIKSGEVKTPCHLCAGQEAIPVGVCAALVDADYVWGGHRSHGHYLAKRANLPEMMAEIFGKTTGCSKGRGGSMHLVAPEVGILGTVPLVAATIPMAAGSGLASKLNGDGKVSVAFFGDGATEEGHFHESLNLASLYSLPVVFVCENNLYSSHMHIQERRRIDRLDLTAEMYGIPGVRLDGNDVLEVYRAAVDAVNRARRFDGPTLLECRTYRLYGHVGPSLDMDVGVKRPDELREWGSKDPINRARRELIERGLSEDQLARIEQQVRSEVEDAIQFARESPYPQSEEVLEHTYCSSDH